MNKETVLQSTLSNFFTSYLNQFLSLLAGILITRSLGPEMKGEYTNYKLLLTLYVPLLTAGYMNGVLFYGLKQVIDIREFYWSGFTLITLLSAALIPVVMFAVRRGWFGEILQGINEASLELIYSLIPLLLLNAYSEKCLRAFGLFRVINRRIIITAVISLVYYLGIWIFGTLDLFTALLGLVIAQGLQLVLNSYFLINKVAVRFHLTMKALIRPWNYGLRSWLNQFLSKANDRFDQIILTFLLPASSYGLYSVGVGLSNMMLTIPDSYSNVFLNQVTTSEGQESTNLYARAQRITLLITSILAFGLALISYPVILLLYGNAFSESALVVVAYTPGLIFQVAARLSIKFYAGKDRPMKSSLIYLAGIAVSLPVYLLLIPRMGIVGAALASSIAYFSAFLFSAIQINREFKLPFRTMLIITRADLIYLRTVSQRIPVVQKFLK